MTRGFKHARWLLAAACYAGFAGTSFAHDDPSEAASSPPGKFGRVSFPTSCAPAAQVQFDRALAMLHSFFFPETVKAFEAIPQTDPGCAIAYWGLAVSQRPNPLVGPFDAATLKRGFDAVEKGEAIGAKTQRERDWLAAIREFYKDYATVDQDTRAKNYERAMEALVARYPDDLEAKIFYALALNETYDHKDKNYAALLKAARLLEEVEPKLPDHPGVTHYIIHSYDFAPIAQRGVGAADRYAQIAPDSPHAVHMPSHIHSQVGLWDKSIAAIERSIAVSRAYMARVKLDGLYGAIPHAWDFMEYAYLQLGRDDLAKAVMDESNAVDKLYAPRQLSYSAPSAIPARYMLERQDWKGAAALQPSPLVTKAAAASPAALAITHFARAMGAARSGDAAAAQADIDKLLAIRSGLEKANQAYWAGQVEIQILAAQGWLAQARDDKAQARQRLAAAADLEDASEKHVTMEHRLYPAREQYADLLLMQGDSAEALKHYEASLASTPNRLRGWYGAAKAAQAGGDKGKAAAYFSKLAELTRSAGTDRAEVREARMQVASR